MGYLRVIFALLDLTLEVSVVAAFGADIGTMRAVWGRDLGDSDAEEGVGKREESDEVHIWNRGTVV
jgi:hypothetical protein